MKPNVWFNTCKLCRNAESNKYHLRTVAGKRLVTGSHDKYMMLADIQGHVQRTWKASHVHDLAISKDGSLLFCVTSEKKVQHLSIAAQINLFLPNVL